MTKNCLICGKEIEVTEKMLSHGRGRYCSRSCVAKPNFTGAKNPKWNGGKKTHEYGYTLIRKPDHPRADSTDYVREHHLVMERVLDRYLKGTEEVHHINGIKTDNRPEDLELMQSRSEHLKKEHKLGTYKNHLFKLNYGSTIR